MKQFEIAGGSVTGRDHVIINKPNQDSYDWIVDEDFITATVCDGCGSQKHSEIGATLGAKIFNSQVQESCELVPLLSIGQLLDKNIIKKYIFRALDNTLCDIVDTAHAMSPFAYVDDIIEKYFLFTIINAFITKSITIISIMGDGMFNINTDTHIIESENNAPSYPAYRLIKHKKKRDIVQHVYATESIEQILLGTDGCTQLINAAEKNIPGREQQVGTLNQFFEDDKFYKNPDMVRRKLAQINKTTQKIDWENRKINIEHGHLKDDTTLIAIRRKENELK